MNARNEVMRCPFCEWKADEGGYAMLLHMETEHAEGPSSSIAANEYKTTMAQSGSALQRPGTPDAQCAECSVDGCGEEILYDELDYHIELHAREVEKGSGGESDGETWETRNCCRPDPLRRVRLETGKKEKDDGVNNEDKDRIDDERTSETDKHLQRRRKHHSHRQSHIGLIHHHKHCLPCMPASDQGSQFRSRQASEEAHFRDQHTLSRQQKAISRWKSMFKMPSQPSGPLPACSSGPSAQQNQQPPRSQSQMSATSSDARQIKRLGKAQLGRYAHEDQMPDWLVRHLQEGGHIAAHDVIPVLVQLLEQSPSTQYAYICHPCVQHVSKLKREGGFCGYRNIQMMTSYIVGVGFKGTQRLHGQVPSIFEIQDLIEAAWDRGINAQGREETGGIRGTRKYIGTPEALALLRLLEIPCDAQGFKDREPGLSETRLLDAVEAYFESGSTNPAQNVRRTPLPPIYFQHAGHSMTIIGIERLRPLGARNLLVFDPMFRDSPDMLKRFGRCFEHRFPDHVLRPYRRGNRYLKRYREFELLRLRPPPGGFLAFRAESVSGQKEE